MFQISDIIEYYSNGNIEADTFTDRACRNLQDFFDVKFHNYIDAQSVIESYLAFCKIIGEPKISEDTHITYDNRIRIFCSHVMPVYYLIFERIIFGKKNLSEILFGQIHQVSLAQRDLANIIMIYYIMQITTSLLLHPSDIFTSNGKIEETNIETFMQIYNDPEITKFLDISKVRLNMRVV